MYSNRILEYYMQDTPLSSVVHREQRTSPGTSIFFAIYARVPNRDNRRIYFRPTAPVRSAQPRKNQILGYELSREEFDSAENYVFLFGRGPHRSTHKYVYNNYCCTIL